MGAETKLAELGLDLPSAAKPLGAYRPMVTVGNVAYLSGHLLTVFREGDHMVPVYLRLSADERGMVEDDRTYFVEGDSGKVPLDSVARSVPRRTTTLIFINI